VRHSSILLKTEVLFTGFQKKSEIHKQFSATVSYYRFTEENGTICPPSGDSKQYSNFQGLQRSFMQGLPIFRHFGH
jgi:hypothetical protein